MADVPLDLDPAMVDNMRREADEHGFDELDGYVEWLLRHRDTVLNEHDVWDAPPSGVADLDADLSQSTGSSIDPDLTGGGDEPSLDPDRDKSSTEPTEESDDEDDADQPEGEAADDDDVAAALEEIELEDDEEN